jgi:hypothetical protein
MWGALVLGPQQTEQQRYCGSCGATVRPSDAFCTYCGVPLALEERRASRNRRSPKRPPIDASHPFSRLWPPSAGREIVAGVLVAMAVAGLLVGLIYGFLALRGTLGDPSVPRTLGLIVFSLIHGAAVSAEVDSGAPSPLGIGGSLRLGLPVSSFALLPFLALLVTGRVVARRTQSTFLFASAAALDYATLVAVLAALGASSSLGNAGGEGLTLQFGAEPFSAAWRALVLAGAGVALGAAASRGPFLPEQPRQVLRGAFAAIGISLAIAMLLAVTIPVVQGFDTTAQQQVSDEQSRPAPEGSSNGEPLAAIGTVFTLLPTLVGTLWLFAHGLPLGLQGAQELAGLPLVGPSLAELPLKVSLLGTWPLGSVWRLLLLGPVVGLVVGGMAAARGSNPNDRSIDHLHGRGFVCQPTGGLDL